MKKIVLLLLFIGVFRTTLGLNILKGYFRGEDLSVVRNRNEMDFIRLLKESIQRTNDASEEQFMKVLDSYLTYEIDELSTILYGEKLRTIIVSLNDTNAPILMKLCKRIAEDSQAGCRNYGLRYATIKILQFLAEGGNDNCIEWLGEIERWQTWEAERDKRCFMHRTAHNTLEILIPCLLNQGNLAAAKELLERRAAKLECCDASAKECCRESVKERAFCYKVLADIIEREELLERFKEITNNIYRLFN